MAPTASTETAASPHSLDGDNAHTQQLKRQIFSSQIGVAQAASPLNATLLAALKPPKNLVTTTTPEVESLQTLLKQISESPQPAFDAKATEAYRKSVGSAQPLQFDINLAIKERERVLEERKELRIQFLEERLSSENLSDSERVKLMIELKSLKLAHIQSALRLDVLRLAHQLRSVDSYVDKSSSRKGKRSSLVNSLRNVVKKDISHGSRKRERNHDFIQAISNRHRDLSNTWRTAGMKRAKLVRHVLQHHTAYEREEIKRQDKLQKDRLRALKNDDEEAYIRLLDQEKDTRLTYLLKQTDEFLSSLASKVAAQQEETQRLFSDESTDLLPVNDLDEGEDGKKTDYWNIAHKIKEEIKMQPNMLSGGQLKEYQLKGLQWMISLYNNHLNGILADEMGLGKTIQTISLISYLMEKKNQNGPYLVIVPLSTMTNWSMEFEKWAPGIIKYEYKGGMASRKPLQEILRHGRFNVLLTTYEYAVKDRAFLSKFKWTYLIVDEGHRMKNSSSKLSIVLTQYYSCKFRLILTGTPLQNNLPELWALLNFLLPHVFNSCTTFEEWFNTPFANTGEKMELNEEEVLLIIRRLHKVLRPFLLRRLKKDVEAELPDKVEVILKCPMSALQQSLYQSITKSSGLGTSDSKKERGFRRLNNTIMQLRKICNHPFVFEEVEAALNPYRVNNDLLYRVAGKFELLSRILPKFAATGHKVLMFFQMTQVMTIMEDFLSMFGYKYLRLDGSVKAEDRTDLLEKFNQPDSPYFVFLLSTRAGGLGLNLQSADTVVIFDSDWNPHQDLQAQDRAHRIGQTKEVRIFRLITLDSIEEYILEKAQHKLSLDGKVIQAGKFDHKSTNEERDAMLKAIMEREAEKIDNDEVYGDDELNEIIARNEKELEIFREIDNNRKETTPSKKSRLIEASELPAVYLNKSAAGGEEYENHEEIDYVRSARKKEISYKEVSDAQWMQQIDGKEQRKRRINNVVDSDEGYSEGSSLANSPVKLPKLKLKIPVKSTATIYPPDNLDVETRTRLMQDICDYVENYCDEETNRYLSEIFMELPDRTDYADYYQIIKEPISIAEIKGRIASGEYASLHQFMGDFELMFSNAQKYNREDSLVYEDALVLSQVARDRFAELMESEGQFDSEDEDDEEIDTNFEESEFDEE